MAEGFTSPQIDAINRAAVIADKHDQAVKRLLEVESDLPDELAAAARRSGNEASALNRLAEQWKHRVDPR